MPRLFKSVLTLAMFVVFSSAVAADPLVFTDRTLFNAAIAGSPRFDEDFQSFTVDTELLTTTVNVNNNFTLRQSGAGSGGPVTSIIDVPPLRLTANFPFFFGVNGTSYLNIRTSAPNAVLDLTFTTPVFAFGGDFVDPFPIFFGSGEGLDLELFRPTGELFATLSVPSPNPATVGFFGFVNAPQDAIGRIRFRSRINEESVFGIFLLDDVTGAVISSPQPVPEPATLLLLGTGLAGVGATVRKRRKVNRD